MNYPLPQKENPRQPFADQLTDLESREEPDWDEINRSHEDWRNGFQDYPDGLDGEYHNRVIDGWLDQKNSMQITQTHTKDLETKSIGLMRVITKSDCAQEAHGSLARCFWKMGTAIQKLGICYPTNGYAQNGIHKRTTQNHS